ncbi:MAG TPA: hypothetical protein VFR97_08045 [Capillimicrobium sp.]|nr:hypothetical protein [Capillimicrobium sp.]
MRRWAVIAVAVVAFVGIAVVLARWLSAEGAERGLVTDLLRAQARGDADAMLAVLDDGCRERPACEATVRADAAALRSEGEIEIVAYDSSTSYALGAAEGPTRVVWRAPGRLTTVQCVEVERGGNALTGPSVQLLSIGRPIGRTAAC